MQATRRSNNTFGRQLRHWRDARGLSQLALATLAETTPRHVSFIETGRSRPGREVVLRIASCLSLPVRATNSLLAAAGFGPCFPEYSLGEETMQPVLAAFEAMLAAHSPYPGCVIDTRGQIHLANATYLKMVPKALSLSPEENIDTFYGNQGRALVENWLEVAWSAYDLRKEHAERSGDPELLRLAERARGHLRDSPRPTSASGESPVPCTKIRLGAITVSTFAAALRFDAAREVTTSELRLELIFPADERSGDIIRWLAEFPSQR